MRVAIFLMACVLASTTHATNFMWHGVVTQGAFHSSGNNVYGQSKNDLSLDFTEASLAVSFFFSVHDKK